MSLAGMIGALLAGMPVFPFILWFASGFLMGPEAERSLKKCFVANLAMSVFGLIVAGATVWLSADEPIGTIRVPLWLVLAWIVGSYRYIGYQFEREDANELGFLALYFIFHGCLAYFFSQVFAS